MSPKQPSRRNWLATVAAAGIGGVAGCQSEDDTTTEETVTPTAESTSEAGESTEADGTIAVDGFGGYLYGPGANSYRSDESGPAGEANVAWDRLKREYDAPVGALDNWIGPAVRNDTLFYHVRDRDAVVALNAADGSLNWVSQRDLDPSEHHALTSFRADFPAVSADAVHALGRDAAIVTYDAETGEKLWEYEADTDTEAGFNSHYVIATDDTVFTLDSNHEGSFENLPGTVALDARKGGLLWDGFDSPYDNPSADGSAQSNTVLLNARDGIVYERVSSYPERLGLREADTGEPIGTVRIQSPVDGERMRGQLSRMGVHEGVAYVAYRTGEADYIAAVEDQEVIWNKSVDDSRGPVLAGDDRIVIGSPGNIQALNPDTGQERWARSVDLSDAEGGFEPVMTDDTIYYSTKHAFDAETGDQVLEYTPEGPDGGEVRPTYPVVVDGVLFTQTTGKIRAVVNA